MSDKVKMCSGNDFIPKVEVSGLDEIFASALDAERVISKYEKFAEHVTLSCAMPEIPRYALEDPEIEGSPLEDAYSSVMRLLARYRRLTAWMRANGIDVEAVAGGVTDAKKTKN